MKTTVKYFPFSPGIGWKIKHGKYIIPEINLDVWNKITLGRNIIIVAYGGLIESYLSLCYLEMLNYIVPSSKMYWCGDQKFNLLARMNGIAVAEQVCPKELLSRYPSPIFMDGDKNVYFNCLNNYQVIKPYYGGKGYKDKSIISKQLLRNSTLSWDKQYIPKFRKLEFPTKEFSQWSRVSRFDLNRPYICIFQNLGLSNHKVSALKWNDTHIKALSAMLRQKGISTLVFTKNTNKFYGSSVYCAPLSLETIIYVLDTAKAILSEEIDFLLLAMMSPKIKIIMNPVKKQFAIDKNSKFFNFQRDNVFVSKHLMPLDAFNIINPNG